MHPTLPAELFVPESLWLLAIAPLEKDLSKVVRQVVRTCEGETAYLPVFTSLENAQIGISWLSPGEPEVLVPFCYHSLARIGDLLNALAILGHTHFVLNPEPDHRGERIAIRTATRAIQRHLLGPSVRGPRPT